MEVTLCSARHLPNVDGGGLLGSWGGSCDAFVEFVCGGKTQKSSVKKKSLDPQWMPEEKFEFPLRDDLDIQLKDWNATQASLNSA